MSPVYKAIASANIGILSMLLAKGANPNLRNANGESPLHLAAQNGSLRMTQLLLDHHTSPNLCRKDDGLLPIHLAEHDGHGNVVKLLERHNGRQLYSVPCYYDM
jgi:ankyrin repeat protein